MHRAVTSLLALGAILVTTPVSAFEATGGEVKLSHSAFTEDSDFSKTTLDGSVEFGFNRNFGIQADLGFHNLNFIDETGTNAALHALYHLNDQTSFGVFYGVDRIMGNSSDFYGIEVGQEGRNFDVEAYVGAGEGSGISGTVAGLSGRYNINEAFALGLALHMFGSMSLFLWKVAGVSPWRHFKAMTPALLTAFSTAVASVSSESECLSSIAALRIVPQGLAIPRPAMSGADPWMGSYNPTLVSPSDAEGNKPSDPTSIDASSVRMSPNMFSVTRTSNSRGRDSRCIAAASTSMCSRVMPGWRAAVSITCSRHRREVSNTFALSTEVTFPRRPAAARKPHSARRSTSPLVYTQVSKARSSVRPRSPKYRPPVSSRTTSRSVPSIRSRRSGLASYKAGQGRTGRRLA